MPKKKDETELPSTIQHSEPHARHIWKKAHDSAVETYGEGESAHRVAFAALKHVYKKEGDKWIKKAKKGPSDPQARRGPTTRRKSTDEPRAETAGGKIARTEKEAKKKKKEARKEDREARKIRETKKKNTARKKISSKK